MDQCREESRHGLPPLTGGGKSVGCVVWEVGRGVRHHVQGATEGIGFLQGVRRDDGGGIPGESPDDSAWAGGRDTTELDNHGRGGRATDILSVITYQGRPVELPSGGMPRPSGDEDGDVGALPAPSCTRHCIHSGGGNYLPPTVHPMRHDGPPEVHEWQASCHRPVRQGREAE